MSGVFVPILDIFANKFCGGTAACAQSAALTPSRLMLTCGVRVGPTGSGFSRSGAQAAKPQKSVGWRSPPGRRRRRRGVRPGELAHSLPPLSPARDWRTEAQASVGGYYVSVTRSLSWRMPGVPTIRPCQRRFSKRFRALASRAALVPPDRPCQRLRIRPTSLKHSSIGTT